MATMIENINRIKNNIQDAYNVIMAKGGTIPQVKNTNNLVNAIQSIDIGSQYAEQVLVSNDNEIVVPNASLKIASLDKLGGASRKGKNILNLNSATTKTIDGVTFTPYFENGKLKYVELQGSPTSSYALYKMNTSVIGSFENGTYTLTGGLSDKIRLRMYNGTPYYDDKGNGVTFDYIKANQTENGFWIVVFSGVTLNGEKVYPMIRLANEANSTYEPYTPNLLDSKVDVIVSNGKNLLKCQQISYVSNGITTTKVSENHYTFKGTTTKAFTSSIAGNPSESIILNIDCSNGVRFYTKNNVYGNLGYRCRIRKIDGTLSYLNIASTPYIKEDGYIESVYVQQNTVGVVIDADIYFQAENGTEESSFEPYHIPYKSSIPQAVQDLDGYGIVGNYIEYKSDTKKWEFHKNFIKPVITSISDVIVSADYGDYVRTNVCGILNDTSNICILSSKYLDISFNNRTNYVDEYRLYLDENGRINFRLPKGVKKTKDEITSLFNELDVYVKNTEVITDITDLFPPNFYQLMVEEKGTIEFHYPALDEGFVVDTPSQTTYIIDTSKL